MINIYAWTGVRRPVDRGLCLQCGKAGTLPLPITDDCAHPDVEELNGSRVERLAKMLRLTYGTPDGARRPIHDGINDWLADAQEVLRAAGVD